MMNDQRTVAPGVDDIVLAVLQVLFICFHFDLVLADEFRLIGTKMDRKKRIGNSHYIVDRIRPLNDRCWQHIFFDSKETDQIILQARLDLLISTR